MKTAKIFQNGQSQAVRLPKEFRFKDDYVYVKKIRQCCHVDSRKRLLGVAA